MPGSLPQGSGPLHAPGVGTLRALPAGPDDLDLFDSLRERRCPPGRFIGDGWVPDETLRVKTLYLHQGYLHLYRKT